MILYRYIKTDIGLHTDRQNIEKYVIIIFSHRNTVESNLKKEQNKQTNNICNIETQKASECVPGDWAPIQTVPYVFLTLSIALYI